MEGQNKLLAKYLGMMKLLGDDVKGSSQKRVHSSYGPPHLRGTSQKVVHSATGPRLPSDIARLKAREILGISPTDNVERCAHKQIGIRCLNTLQTNKNSSTLLPSANEKILNFSNQLRIVLVMLTVYWGMYALVLEQWYEVFGSDLLVFPTEGLFSENFQKTLDSIFSHIGLPTYEGVNEVCTDVFMFTFCLL